MDTRGFNEKDITQSLDKITNAIKATGGELPPVTSDDNGKILKVVNGDWNKATASGGGETFHIVYTENSGSTTADKTSAELLAAIEAGKRITCDMIIEGSGQTTVIENVPLSSYSIEHDVFEEIPTIHLNYTFSFFKIAYSGGDMYAHQVDGVYECTMTNPIEEYEDISLYTSSYESSK